MNNSLYKYPRTYHLPFSPGLSKDDRRISNKAYEVLREKEIIVTEKMDGENTTIYSSGYIHARSLTSSSHISRSWIRQYAASFAYRLPDGWRICGENLYATHSLSYDSLESFYLAFSVFDHTNTCISWKLTIKLFEELRLSYPKILYKGPFCEKTLKELALAIDIDHCEGFVVRTIDSFSYTNFEQNVAKWVRHNHVQTPDHWMQQEVHKNKLAML